MTVIEFVMASFILFFVLTAILGLIGATTKTSVIAKQRAAMTNAVSSYIDYARGLPFYAVELRSVSASGAIDSTVTTATAGFTVTLTNTVRLASDGTKELRVNAVCTAVGYPTMTTSAFAAIRDRSTGLTTVAPTAGPRIWFGTLTPPQGSVVHDSNVDGLGALYIDADAECDEGELSVLEFVAEGHRLRNGADGSADEAYWVPGATTYYKSFLWNTRQVESTSTDPAIQDGWRIVRIEAVDSLGRHAQKERRFLVDNHAPADPGEPRAMANGWKDAMVLLNWDAAYDGTDPAYRYTLQTYRDHAGASDLAEWTSAGTFTLTQPAHTLATSAFSRYYARVQAASPRGLPSNWVSASAPFYSRPLCSGSSSCTVTGKLDATASNVAVQLACTPPTFWVSSITYDLYRGTSPATLAPYRSAVSFPFSETIVDVIGKTGSPIAYYYQVVATFTPAGWSGGTTEVVRSNVVGPTAAVDGTGGTLGMVW